MKRYNIFYQVHKGLREMLYQTSSLLQQTDFEVAEESDSALTQLKQVLALFGKHADTEDSLVLPAIEVYEPSVTLLFEEEHAKDHELSNRLRSLINMFHVTSAAEEQSVFGSAIRFSFAEFMIFNLQHMAKEETVLNNLLWNYYTDDQLQGITQLILTNLPQEIMMQYSTWMMRALSNTEIKNWLCQIKNNAPDFVFSSMLALAQAELSGHRWNIIQESITEGAMVA
jgi:hemerythrin-like domain-containing protein